MTQASPAKPDLRARPASPGQFVRSAYVHAYGRAYGEYVYTANPHRHDPFWYIEILELEADGKIYRHPEAYL